MASIKRDFSGLLGLFTQPQGGVLLFLVIPSSPSCHSRDLPFFVILAKSGIYRSFCSPPCKALLHQPQSWPYLPSLGLWATFRAHRPRLYIPRLCYEGGLGKDKKQEPDQDQDR